ncbi:Cysteine protease atg4 [Actinomortierella wolfii]|nr:Cysteine protease atg4 [Actinomortierella wolfii]
MSAALESSHDPAQNVDNPTSTSTSTSEPTSLVLTHALSFTTISEKTGATDTSSQSTASQSPGAPKGSTTTPKTTTTSVPSPEEEQRKQGRKGNHLCQGGDSPAACGEGSGHSPPGKDTHTLPSNEIQGATSSSSKSTSPQSSGSMDSTPSASLTENQAATEMTPGASTTDASQASAPSTPRAGSRFSMNLASVGLTQANGERAVDMAQDLKKNVVNLWNTWFPTPPSAQASVGARATGSSSTSPEPLSSTLPPRSSTFSGSHTLSHHHMQSPRQLVAERPAKTIHMNSSKALSALGNSASGSSANATFSATPDTTGGSLSSSAPSKHTHRRSSPAAARSKSPSTLAGLRSSTPQEGLESSLNTSNPPSTVQSSQPRSNSPIYLMGKLYPPSTTQWTDFQSDFTNGLIWCTYRHSYAPIRPSNFTTDVGWGCMLRSGQSLLANALAVQFMGRGWTRPAQGDTFWDIYVKVISWFFDDMTSRSPFSVHRIALLGKQLGKNIGEWFGPSTTSQVIKALVDNFPDSGLSVYVTTDGVIYKDQVEETATMKGKSSFGHLLILATIRLGIDKVNPVYHNAIKNLATYHCDTIRKIDIGSVDPSMLIAFYCKDRSDFDIFCKQVQAMNELVKSDITAAGQSGSEIISIGERAPVYDSGDDMDGHLLTVADEEDEDLELVL